MSDFVLIGYLETEVDRLRTQNNHLISKGHDFEEENKELRAELEQLREDNAKMIALLKEINLDRIVPDAIWLRVANAIRKAEDKS